MRACRFMSAVGIAATLVSCVDLLHSTDVETLCDTTPGAQQCAASGLTGCTTGPAARNAAEHACAWLGACEGGTGANAFASCMVDALRIFDCAVAPNRKAQNDLFANWNCLASASSCGDVDRCIYGGKQAPECPAVGSSSGCVDDRVYTICQGAGRPINAEDCALKGKICSGDPSGTFGCTGKQGRSACTASGCSERDGKSYVVRCSTNVDTGFDCSGYNATCNNDGDIPVCEFGGAPCSATGTITCRGSTAVMCGGEEKNAHEDSVDCGAIGRACRPIGATQEIDPIAACVGDQTCTDGCSGATMTSCASDTVFNLDCGSLGLTCTKESGHARCAVPTP